MKPNSDKNQEIENSSFQNSQTQQSQAQRDSIQNQNSGNQFIQLIQIPSQLPRWAQSSTLMYALSGILAVIGILVAWTLKAENSLIGVAIIGVSFYFSLLGLKLESVETEKDKEGDKSHYRNFYVNGINDNDYTVNIQGFDIDFQDQLLEVLTQIQNMIQNNHTNQKQSFKTKLANDLAKAAYSNQALKEKIEFFSQTLETFEETQDLEDGSVSAKQVINDAARILKSTFQDPILVFNKQYQKLDFLLRERKWEEADQETFKLMLEMSQKNSAYYDSDWLTRQGVALIPGKELRIIDKLWVAHSGGRFGFSIQQKIWKANRNEYNGSIGFGQQVGWAKEGDWIFAADIIYSLKAPKGHLPAMALFDPQPLRWGDYRYNLKIDVCEVLMDRSY